MREIPQIMFEACVLAESENARYDLTEPFWQDGSLFATDGRILVRWPVTLEELRDGREPGDRIHLPVAPSIFGTKVSKRSLPNLAFLFQQSPFCTESVLTPFVNRWLRCSTCDRLGNRCGPCAAGGRLPDWSEVRVRGREHPVSFAACYLGLLWEMGVHQFFVRPGAEGRTSPAAFKTPDGVEGLLMPRVPE